MKKRYKVHPLLLGEAQVGCILDVFWGMNPDDGKVKVPIYAFLIEGGPDPIIVDAGMRSAERAVEIHRLGPHWLPETMTLTSQLAKIGVKPQEIKTCILPICTTIMREVASSCRTRALWSSAANWLPPPRRSDRAP